MSILPLRAADTPLVIEPSLTIGVTNYTLYSYFGGTNIHKLHTGTNLTATLTDLKPGQWTFKATAWKDNVESGFSPALNIEVPQAPPGVKIVLQFSPTVASTNWQDVGFFRIKVP